MADFIADTSSDGALAETDAEGEQRRALHWQALMMMLHAFQFIRPGHEIDRAEYQTVEDLIAKWNFDINRTPESER